MSANTAFDAFVPEIVASIRNTVSTAHAGSFWREAVFTNLQSGDGTALLKMRVKLANEVIDAELEPARSIRTSIYDMWEEMFKQSKDIWYGFKLTVYPDGRHEIEYNYDPNCIDDPSFIDF